MSLTTDRRLNHQRFNPPPSHSTSSTVCTVLRAAIPAALTFNTGTGRPFHEAEDGAGDDAKNPIYALSDEDNRKNGDERDDDDNDNSTNFDPPLDLEMAQGPEGVTIHNIGQNNVGVHQNSENTGCTKIQECTKTK